ncbi:DNA polymerase ligase N-terminal domain-containing protein [Methanobacterium oryzae]|uniref:DNA polymerase ligase N-terminal domain-containing protein n=1 Tax=Methanobacterium oryzae TaxID=69540 RepID=UPI003D1E5E47
MAKEDPLKKYKEKRDFKKTPEPTSSEKVSFDNPRFVVQKHDASRLHYDFRLEVNGVLKSWAIPKGPSLDPGQKRLAVPTEDHPIDYIDFEGIIPKGNYGAGTVIVWDTGTYRNLKKNISMDHTVEDGHIDIWLDGEKLKGGYALIQTGKGNRKFWLLFKKKDDKANSESDILIDRPESVLSGRIIDEIINNKKS